MVMGDGQQGGIVVIDAFEQQIQNDFLIVRIKIAGGFVRQDQCWLR